MELEISSGPDTLLSILIRTRHIAPQYNPSEKPFTPRSTLDYIADFISSADQELLLAQTYSLNRETAILSLDHVKMLVWDDALIQLIGTLVDFSDFFEPTLSQEGSDEPERALLTILTYIACEQAVINNNIDLAVGLSFFVNKHGYAHAPHVQMGATDTYHRQLLEISTISVAAHEVAHLLNQTLNEDNRYARIFNYTRKYFEIEFRHKVRFRWYDGVIPSMEGDFRESVIAALEQNFLNCISDDALAEEFLADIISTTRVLERATTQKNWRQAYRNMLVGEFLVHSAHQIIAVARKISNPEFDRGQRIYHSNDVVDIFQMARWRVRLAASFFTLLGTDRSGRVITLENFEEHELYADACLVVDEIEGLVRKFEIALFSALRELISLCSTCAESGREIRAQNPMQNGYWENFPLFIIGWL